MADRRVLLPAATSHLQLTRPRHMHRLVGSHQGTQVLQAAMQAALRVHRRQLLAATATPCRRHTRLLQQPGPLCPRASAILLEIYRSRKLAALRSLDCSLASLRAQSTRVLSQPSATSLSRTGTSGSPPGRRAKYQRHLRST